MTEPALTDDCYERDLYDSGLSIQQVANQVELSYTATRYRLLKQGTKLRAKNGKQKVDRKN